MNCPLRSLSVIALAGLLLSVAAPAGAQPVVDLPRIEVVSPPTPVDPSTPATPSPLTPPPPSERVLVGPVRGKQGNEPQLQQALDEHLRNSGLRLVERAAAGAPQECETIECLDTLVRREQVGFLLLAQIDEHGMDNSYVSMTLFDPSRRASLQEKAKCWQCTRTLLGHKLNEVADVLIARCREARRGVSVPNETLNASIVLPAPPPPAAPNAATVGTIPPAKQGYFARLPRSRKILASVLGGMAGAALLTSIVLTVTDGLDTPIGCEMRMDVLQDKCILKNKSLYGPGYALTGALAVGIGFTLFWPQKSVKTAAPEVR